MMADRISFRKLLLLGGIQDYAITANPSAGCSFVWWEVDGDAIIVRDPKAQTAMIRVNGPGTLRIVYAAGCCKVGGVMTPTNTSALLAPTSP